MEAHKIFQYEPLAQAALRIPALGQLLQDRQVERRLQALSSQTPQLCVQTLALCAPALAQLGEQADEAWLRALYEQLNDNLFPDPRSGHVRGTLSPGQQLYLAVLESALDHPAGAFDALNDLYLPPDWGQSRVEAEFGRFCSAVSRDHFLALLHLGRQLQPFDPASHTIGVHNVALHTAALAVKAGIPVDLKLVCAASLGHDIGKFGCRGEDSKRVPYLHYYYTWQWFSENRMERIGSISANHSTWDLEFENLPIESLLLIYADFRVRGTRTPEGREQMAVYSLADSYEMIFSKLYNMTPEKKRRYQTVYYKLRDFERYLQANGVPVELDRDSAGAPDRTDASLLPNQQALQALRNMTFANNIRLMRTISVDESFEQLLEQARGEKNLHRVRTYLSLFEEYSTYMTKENKQKLLSLLYELLMHQDGDVRRTAGCIMGQLLANSGPKYRKERPQAAPKDAITPTMLALLDESVELWSRYVELCLHPGHKVSARHALRISNSLKTICEAMFACCDEKEAEPMLRPLLAQLWQAQGADRFVLVDALRHVPCHYIPADARGRLIEALGAMLPGGDAPLQLAVLQTLEQLGRSIPALGQQISAAVRAAGAPGGEYAGVIEFLRRRILGEATLPVTEDEVSKLYLSNLKNAVDWTVKLAQIDMLCAHVRQQPQSAFHTAMHLSNLLSVSEHLPVRQYAGEKLIEIAPHLTVDQINEISVDLVRELENGQEQISRFIPPYAGRLICLLPEKELREMIDSLETMVHGPSVRPARVALRTLGEILPCLTGEQEPLADLVLGLLMTGVCHYEATIHQTALSVLCREVFGRGRIPMARRHDYFVRLAKKLLTILSEPRDDMLTFFNRAAMLNHLYRYMVCQEVADGPFRFPAELPVAFFPGTFDPFSVGHKRIVKEIRACGFEVYLAVDEFSWSKNTLAKRLRRQIVGMSVADLWDTYLFPDEIPVNIAMPEDLAMLQGLFAGRELYLVAGSDVIRNASAYRSTAPGSAAEYNHVVFCRDGTGQEPGKTPLEQIIRGKLRLMTLPEFFDTVSSTRIREYVDKNLDISMLVDPVVQTFIYERGLYVHSPEMKNVLTPQALFYRRYRSGSLEAPAALNRALCRTAKPLAVTLCARPDTLIGWAMGHTLQSSDLFQALQSLEAAAYVRRHASGRILMIDQVFSDHDGMSQAEACRLLLNELLARSLECDHTYAICRCTPRQEALRAALGQLGFVPVEGQENLYYVDMRAPIMLLQDVLLRIKKPHHDDPEVQQVVARTRPRLRLALTQMFPGELVLCFDSEQLNQALMERVQQLNGVPEQAAGSGRRLGPYMCVPYGKILADEIVPHTVTKTLHVEKAFRADMSGFDIVEYPGHSPLKTQVRTLKSFRRPVILVDDLLHKGYRIEKLDKIFKEEDLKINKLIVAIMSGYGEDLMRVQNRQVDCEYFIPNLHYWMTESLLYPFIGGDSIGGRMRREHLLPSINLILPYIFPRFLSDAPEQAIRALSGVALRNACEILKVLERRHQKTFNTALSIQRLGEALQRPRLPDKGACMRYDLSMPASVYLEDDLAQLERMFRKGGSQ